jgi:hypothetical protein
MHQPVARRPRDRFFDSLPGRPDRGPESRSSMLRPLLSLLCPLLCCAVSGAALAATPDRRVESNQANAELGDDVVSVGDVNGDGYDDVAASALDYSNGQTSEGAVFVFHGGPNGIEATDVSQADSVLESNQESAVFGTSVAGAGDVDGDGYDDLLVGAPRYEDPANPHVDEGAIFVFLGRAGGIPSGGLELAATVVQSDRPNSRLGESVAAAGDVNADGYDDVVAGGWLYFNGETEEGVAIVCLGSEDGIASGGIGSAAAAVIESNHPGANLGDSVAGSGDVNGDGFDDVVVGAPEWSDPQTREGAVFVFLGSAAGIPGCSPTCTASAAAARIEGEQPGARLGIDVALADVDADGFDDVVAGAPLWEDGQADEGAAFVFRGDPTGTSATGLAGCASSPCGVAAAATRIESNQEGAQLGSVVAGRPALERDARDAWGGMNADGIDDVALGAGFYESDARPSQQDEGAVFVFTGSATGIASGGVAGAHRRLELNRRGAQLAQRSGLAFADPDGDGYADVLAGDLYYTSDLFTQVQEGALQIFLAGPPAACENGLDDDGDGPADLADAGCASNDDAYEEIDFSGANVANVATAQAETVIARDGTNDAPTTVVLGLGGSVAGSLVAIEHSALRLEGGSVAGSLVAGDAATAEISGGSVAGSVVANGSAVVTIRGGQVSALDANDAARIRVVGSGFGRPFGELAETSGFLVGTLEDGTPIDAAFTRDAGAAIELVPEPGATALGVASALALAALRRRS